MFIGTVAGPVVATAKNAAYNGQKILQVRPADWRGRPLPTAPPVVALDLVDAGAGDLVLVCQEGSWAREALGDMNAPVRSMVVAVISGIDIDEVSGKPIFTT